MINEDEPTSEEWKLIQRIRQIRPYERIEIKINDQKPGQVVYTITSNVRVTFQV